MPRLPAPLFLILAFSIITGCAGAARAEDTTAPAADATPSPARLDLVSDPAPSAEAAARLFTQQRQGGVAGLCEIHHLRRDGVVEAWDCRSPQDGPRLVDTRQLDEPLIQTLLAHHARALADARVPGCQPTHRPDIPTHPDHLHIQNTFINDVGITVAGTTDCDGAPNPSAQAFITAFNDVVHHGRAPLPIDAAATLASLEPKVRLSACFRDDDCVVVPFRHCCGSTKRAIHRDQRAAYDRHPEWQVFDEPVCATMGQCPDDSHITEGRCEAVDGSTPGFCTLRY